MTPLANLADRRLAPQYRPPFMLLAAERLAEAARNVRDPSPQLKAAIRHYEEVYIRTHEPPRMVMPERPEMSE